MLERNKELDHFRFERSDLHPGRAYGVTDMRNDPIVEEVREIRRAYGARFGFDLRAMAADLRKKEQEHPQRLVSLSPKPVRRRKSA